MWTGIADLARAQQQAIPFRFLLPFLALDFIHFVDKNE
jgi:hypothetical protein